MGDGDETAVTVSQRDEAVQVSHVAIRSSVAFKSGVQNGPAVVFDLDQMIQPGQSFSTQTFWFCNKS